MNMVITMKKSAWMMLAMIRPMIGKAAARAPQSKPAPPAIDAIHLSSRSVRSCNTRYVNRLVNDRPIMNIDILKAR